MSYGEIPLLSLEIHSPICLRNTNHCSNNALIGSDKLKYGNLCQMSDSIGRRSAHNCKNHIFVRAPSIKSKFIEQPPDFYRLDDHQLL